MKQTQTAMYLLGAIVIAAIIGLASYFLVISPELDAGATARVDTETAQQNNQLLETQIAGMKVKEQQVPHWRDQIALISLDLPPLPEQSALERLVDGALSDLKLPSMTVSYGQPAPIAGPAAPASAQAPAVQPSPGPTPSPSATPTPESTSGSTDAGSTDGSFAGLVGIPVTISTEGSPTAVLSFLKFMQSQNDRFYTVTNFSIAKAAATDARPGMPKLAEGDWVLNIVGLVFSLTDETASFPPDEAGPIPAPTGKIPNPFVPLVPST